MKDLEERQINIGLRQDFDRSDRIVRNKMNRSKKRRVKRDQRWNGAKIAVGGGYRQHILFTPGQILP